MNKRTIPILLVFSLVGMSLASCAGLAFWMLIDRPVGMFPAQFVMGQAMGFFTVILVLAWYDHLNRKERKP